MRWVVCKFGGTSVSTPERLAVLGRVAAERRAGGRVAIVASALCGVTDLLCHALAEAADGGAVEPTVEELTSRHLGLLQRVAPGDESAARAVRAVAAGLTRQLAGIGRRGVATPAAADSVLASGERLSSPVVVAALRARGLEAVPVDGAELVSTDARFGCATVDPAATEQRCGARLGQLPAASVPVVSGFVGATADGRTTTLGRGGSDLTATALGAALAARRVEIWSDVDGVLSADPRRLPGSVPLSHLSYGQATTLARFGARVLFPRCLAPAAEREIPVWVGNTLDPAAPGTWISRRPARAGGAVAVLDEVEELRVNGAAMWSEVGELLADATEPVLHVAATGERTQLLVRCDAADAVTARLLEATRRRVTRRGPFAVLALVGGGALVRRCLAALQRQRTLGSGLGHGFEGALVALPRRAVPGALAAAHRELLAGMQGELVARAG